MLNLGGQEVFRATTERLFSEVTDLDALAEAIPDLVSYERVDETRLKCVVRPGFSFLRMKMKIDLSLDKNPQQMAAHMYIDARAIGTTIEVQSHMAVVDHPSGSQLDWSAEVTRMTGLVSSVSADLVKAAADQVIRESWARLRARLGE